MNDLAARLKSCPSQSLFMKTGSALIRWGEANDKNSVAPKTEKSTGIRNVIGFSSLQSALEQGSRDQERRDPKSKQEEQVHADRHKATVLEKD